MKPGDGNSVVVARSRVIRENFSGMMTNSFQVVRRLFPIAVVEFMNVKRAANTGPIDGRQPATTILRQS